MKTLWRTLAPIALVVLVFVAPRVNAVPQIETPEGWKPYTPSRIEWACVELNSLRHEHIVMGSDPTYQYSLNYTRAQHEPNTVVVDVSYFSTTERSVVNTVVERAKKDALNYAKSRRWNWMIVKDHVVMLDAKKETK